MRGHPSSNILLPPEIPAVHILLHLHWLQIVLHTPARLYWIWDDADWLASADFLKAAEHSALLVGCLNVAEINSLPHWILEGIIFTAIIHILLIRKLFFSSGHNNDDLELIKADLRTKVDAAIRVFEAIGRKRPSANIFAFILKLALTRNLGISGYFDEDDQQPAVLDVDLLLRLRDGSQWHRGAVDGSVWKHGEVCEYACFYGISSQDFVKLSMVI